MEKNSQDTVNIIITLGPTDEVIDDIMKITNMSTGFLGITIAKTIMKRQNTGSNMNLWLLCNKTTYLINKEDLDELMLKGARLVITGGAKNGVQVISETEDMMNELEKLFNENRINYLFHSSAVGDYGSRYVSSATMLAKEIYAYIQAAPEKAAEEDIASILRQPKNVFNQDTKMTSDEPDMIVGLKLTPKVISRINGFAEKNGYKIKMISWKLLSGVSEEELYDVALDHGKRNGSFLVVGNDLDRIAEGGVHWAMIIDVATGEKSYAQTKQEIADQLAARIGLI